MARVTWHALQDRTRVQAAREALRAAAVNTCFFLLLSPRLARRGIAVSDGGHAQGLMPFISDGQAGSRLWGQAGEKRTEECDLFPG